MALTREQSSPRKCRAPVTVIKQPTAPTNGKGSNNKKQQEKPLPKTKKSNTNKEAAPPQAKRKRRESAAKHEAMRKADQECAEQLHRECGTDLEQPEEVQTPNPQLPPNTSTVFATAFSPAFNPQLNNIHMGGGVNQSELELQKQILELKLKLSQVQSPQSLGRAVNAAVKSTHRGRKKINAIAQQDVSHAQPFNYQQTGDAEVLAQLGCWMEDAKAALLKLLTDHIGDRDDELESLSCKAACVFNIIPESVISSNEELPTFTMWSKSVIATWWRQVPPPPPPPFNTTICAGEIAKVRRLFAQVRSGEAEGACPEEVEEEEEVSRFRRRF